MSTEYASYERTITIPTTQFSLILNRLENSYLATTSSFYLSHDFTSSLTSYLPSRIPYELLSSSPLAMKGLIEEEC